MKAVYPVILSPAKCGYVVSVPDLNIDTQGSSVAEAIAMARDAIGIWGITEQDFGRDIPQPGDLEIECADDELVTLVDIDFDEYRKAHDNRSVRRNITLPSWLNELAEKSGINVSGVTQRALKAELKVES